MTKRNYIRYITYSILIIILVGVFIGYRYYTMIFKPNLVLPEKTGFLYIKTGSDYKDVYRTLKEKNYLKDTASFLWLAPRKNYPNHVYPGKYKLRNNMNNNQLINLLRSGQQEPVNLIFNNIRTKTDLAGTIGRQIEADSLDIINALNNDELIDEFGMNSENIMCLFIPNTYELYWNTGAKGFIDRMYKEFQRFWNENRLQKLQRIKLSKTEAIIMASIVEQETRMNDEKQRLAGVYINRIHKGMPLQADPTLVFAHGDFTIKRVLNEHKTIVSPYNTYLNRGLPPGPICIPSIASIDAVLNYEHHDYLYFCARDDFSGYHVFSKTLRQHNINAEKYQRALNKNRVYR